MSSTNFHADDTVLDLRHGWGRVIDSEITNKIKVAFKRCNVYYEFDGKREKEHAFPSLFTKRDALKIPGVTNPVELVRRELVEIVNSKNIPEIRIEKSTTKPVFYHLDNTFASFYKKVTNVRVFVSYTYEEEIK